MKIIPQKDVEAENVEEASKLKVQWLITKGMGAPTFAMRLFEMKPEGHSPLHSHAWEHEVYILEGKGTLVIEQGEKRFEAGDAILVLPNEKHQFKNTGAQILRFLCLVPIHK